MPPAIGPAGTDNDGLQDEDERAPRWHMERLSADSFIVHVLPIGRQWFGRFYGVDHAGGARPDRELARAAIPAECGRS
jgi:hypothetical protein